jgi:hypothetical protein
MSAETAWRQQFHSLFLSDFFPADLLTARARAEADADPGAATAFFAGMSWLVDLQDLDVRSPALHSAVAALSVARVGRARGDAALLARARGLYAGALAKLGRALASAVDRLSDETLAACVTLSLYELTETPPGAKSAYMQHQRGALILLKMRGPDAIAASPLGHNIFLGVRSVAVRMPFPCLTWRISSLIITTSGFLDQRKSGPPPRHVPLPVGMAERALGDTP